MNEKRGAWYLLTGILAGVVIGVILAMWVVPVHYVNTDPSSLNADGRAAYRILAAQSYLAEGDAGRALARLALLKEANQADLMIAQAQTLLSKGGSESQARALAMLAAMVREPSIAITPLPFTANLVGGLGTPTPTLGPIGIPTEATPEATGAPRATATSMPPAAFTYTLVEQTPGCDTPSVHPLLKVMVMDSAGQAVAGVPVEVSRAGGGVETFSTGLYPAISPGYADYEMIPSTVYALRVGESGQQVPDLSAPACGEGDDGKSLYGSILLVFQQK